MKITVKVQGTRVQGQMHTCAATIHAKLPVKYEQLFEAMDDLT